jgi:hypothetical protein
MDSSIRWYDGMEGAIVAVVPAKAGTHLAPAATIPALTEHGFQRSLE